MTVSELRKKMKGVPGRLEVYTRDFDQSWFETNALVSTAEIVNQRDMKDWEKQAMRRDHGDNMKKKGNYFVIG